MQKSICKFNFRDVGAKLAEFNKEVRRKVERVGQEAVNYAKEHGDYHDVTGRLRASNRYEVDGNNNLRLYNECDYAADVEANGKDVIGNAALFAEKLLNQ